MATRHRATATTAALSVLWFAASWVPAQDPSWNLPPATAAVFDREASTFWVGVPERAGGSRFSVVERFGRNGGGAWRYRADAAAPADTSWTTAEFDDAAWTRGRGPFVSDPASLAIAATAWTSKHLQLRRELDLGRRRPKALLVSLHHDDGARVYLNGMEVAQAGGVGSPHHLAIVGDALEAWQRGTNTLAVHCENTRGAGKLDVEVVQWTKLPAGVGSAPSLVTWWQDQLKGAQAMARRAVAGFRCPPLLFAGELDEQQRFIAQAPIDLRDVGLWIATDLGIDRDGGSLRRTWSRIVRFGDLHVIGKGRPHRSDRWQELDVNIVATEPAPHDDTDPHMRSYVASQTAMGIEGAVRVRRRWSDEGRGEATATNPPIVEFDATFAGVLRDRKDAATAYPFFHREQWRHQGLRQRNGDFRAAVARAIDSGTAFLAKKLANPDHRDVGPTPGANRSYPSGRLALALLALIKGNPDRNDEVLVKGLDALRQRELVDTYSLGNALMALEAWYAPKSEFADIMSGTIPRPRPRQVPDSDRAIMQKWADQVIANRDMRVDQAYLLRFNYVGGNRYDHSVNQYGLLGLYSAHLCGVSLSPQVWEAAANHLIAAQCRSEPKLMLELSSERDGGTTQSGIPCLPAGWHYEGPGNDGNPSPACGSMTSAGLTGLIICQAALADYDVTRLKLQAQIDRARHAGFGWFARHLQVRYNPGWVGRQDRWVYYYLYGLERSCILAGIKTINGRDWYFEGANLLVDVQSADGSWPAEPRGDGIIERTAMAVLFLKKASVPVLSGSANSNGGDR